VAGDTALRLRPPAFEAARRAYTKSIEIDHYNIRPWVGLAELEYAYWRSPEQANLKQPGWMKVLLALDSALDATWRNPANLGLRRRQVSFAQAILRDLPANASPEELLSLKTTIAKACRWAARIYPTSAPIRAELAQASSEIGMYPDAIR